MVSPGNGHFSLWLISGYCGQGDDTVMANEWTADKQSHFPGTAINTALHLLNVPPGEYEQINHRLWFALTLFTIIFIFFSFYCLSCADYISDKSAIWPLRCIKNTPTQTGQEKLKTTVSLIIFVVFSKSLVFCWFSFFSPILESLI